MASMSSCEPIVGDSASSAEADEVVRSIKAAGGKALAIKADAADTEAVRLAVAKTIGNILKRLWLEYTKVVHENVHEREPLEQRLCRRCRGEIAGEAFNLGVRLGLNNLLFASATAFFERPFTMTRAPSRASPAAMANPMPLVEPETRAVLSVSFKSINYGGTVANDVWQVNRKPGERGALVLSCSARTIASSVNGDLTERGAQRLRRPLRD